MFDVNATIIIFMVMYGLFIVTLNEVMLKPVGKVLAARAEGIRADIAAGKESQAKAQEVLVEYQNRVAQLKDEAQKLINDTVTKSQEKRNAEIRKVAEQSRVKLEEAKKQFHSERLMVMDELVEQEVALVKSMVDKLLGESILVSLDKGAVRRALEESV